MRQVVTCGGYCSHVHSGIRRCSVRVISYPLGWIGGNCKIIALGGGLVSCCAGSIEKVVVCGHLAGEKCYSFGAAAFS